MHIRQIIMFSYYYYVANAVAAFQRPCEAYSISSIYEEALLRSNETIAQGAPVRAAQVSTLDPIPTVHVVCRTRVFCSTNIASAYEDLNVAQNARHPHTRVASSRYSRSTYMYFMRVRILPNMVSACEALKCRQDAEDMQRTH
jgi:hypothetical protein